MGTKISQNPARKIAPFTKMLTHCIQVNQMWGRPKMRLALINKKKGEKFTIFRIGGGLNDHRGTEQKKKQRKKRTHFFPSPLSPPLAL